MLLKNCEIFSVLSSYTVLLPLVWMIYTEPGRCMLQRLGMTLSLSWPRRYHYRDRGVVIIMITTSSLSWPLCYQYHDQDAIIIMTMGLSLPWPRRYHYHDHGVIIIILVCGNYSQYNCNYYVSMTTTSLSAESWSAKLVVYNVTKDVHDVIPSRCVHYNCQLIS